MIQTRRLASLAISAVLALAALPAGAQERASRMKGLALNNDTPIQIESDSLEIREQEKKAIFTGNVKVAQGPTTLRAGHMVVYYVAEGGSVSSGNADIDRLEVSKKVVLSSGNQNASADTGVFNMKTEILVLEGKKVVLSEGQNIFTGCKLTVQMKTGEARLESCGGRVRIQLDPKTRKTK
jgi:lipopolysaccharide export system protein LptA